MQGSNIKLLKITKGVFRHYKKDIRDNHCDRWYMAKKKLTRNWLLGKFLKKEGSKEWRAYGNLHICLDIDKNIIVWISNLKGTEVDFDIDYEKKKELEEQLNIHKYRINKNYKV